jgi:hypothetical protein
MPHAFLCCVLNIRTATSIGVAMRFLPLHLAHPGPMQDDGARQVSWLPGQGLVRLPGRLAAASGI